LCLIIAFLFFEFSSFVDNPRCPVKAFKACIRRPPAESLTPESRFYLSISPRYHNKTVVDVENTNICKTIELNTLIRLTTMILSIQFNFS
jgi:hypothetical protein